MSKKDRLRLWLLSVKSSTINGLSDISSAGIHNRYVSVLKHALLGAPAVLCLLVRSSVQHQALFPIAFFVSSMLSGSNIFPSQTLFRTGVPQASTHKIDHRRVELGPWSMAAAVLLSVMPFAVAAAAACAKIRGRVR